MGHLKSWLSFTGSLCYLYILGVQNTMSLFHNTKKCIILQFPYLLFWLFSALLKVPGDSFEVLIVSDWFHKVLRHVRSPEKLKFGRFGRTWQIFWHPHCLFLVLYGTLTCEDATSLLVSTITFRKYVQFKILFSVTSVVWLHDVLSPNWIWGIYQPHCLGNWGKVTSRERHL